MCGDVFTVSDAARILEVRPRLISDLFYQRVLDTDRCPIVGGRRLIPKEYLSAIKRALAQRGARAMQQGANHD